MDRVLIRTLHNNVGQNRSKLDSDSHGTVIIKKNKNHEEEDRQRHIL